MIVLFFVTFLNLKPIASPVTSYSTLHEIQLQKMQQKKQGSGWSGSCGGELAGPLSKYDGGVCFDGNDEGRGLMQRRDAHARGGEEDIQEEGRIWTQSGRGYGTSAVEEGM